MRCSCKKEKIRFFRSVVLSVCIASSLTGCGNETSGAEQPAAVATTHTTTPSTVTDAETTLTAAAETTAANAAQSAMIAEAEAAARDYYAQTVFQVESMEVKTCTADTVIFTVHAAKDGKPCPPRIIELRNTDGKWEKVNERY